MSYDPRRRPSGAPRGDQDGERQKGSVRAARERLQAAQTRNQRPDTSKIIGLPQRPNQLVSQFASSPRTEQSRSQDVRDDGMVSPTPQWPLPNSSEGPLIPPRSPKRLQHQQQSARPMSDDLPIQMLSPEYAPSSNYNPIFSPEYDRTTYQNEEMFSPSSHHSSRPLTTSSAASEGSSIGDIPDFPVPQMPMPAIQQARRMPSLGPPPSARPRRHPSSFFTQMSYVSPIAEESETRSVMIQSRHGSFASSNVFPTNHNYPDDDLFSDDDETITSDRGTISPAISDDHRGLVKESPALLRQASLGRRTKPSLMTIKSVDSMGERKNSAKNAAIAAGAVGLSGAMFAGKRGKQGDDFGTGLADVSSSSSESLNSFRNMKPIIPTNLASPVHPLQQETRPGNLNDRAGMRRPPKLDMDAVRDAEARGSLTSLPDLIRRATRLAANLDRGKTASRLGLDFWEAGAPEKKNGRQSGLSDMLAAFPPPGQDTPQRTGTPNHPMSKWPSAGIDSRAGMTDSGMSNEKSKQRRRCCGMPLWTFITLLIVLIFVIAAAVVIPVVLVVIPNQTKTNNSAAQESQTSGNNNGGANSNVPAPPAPTLAPGNNQCDGAITCQNGGVPILNQDRTCNCLCINGFTGRTCTNSDATGCTTTAVPGAANNATMGSAIPRLLSDSVSSFNIPLNSTRVLAAFSQLSLSCATQNALITFNGLATRQVAEVIMPVQIRETMEPTRSIPLLLPDAHNEVKRQAIGAPGAPSPSSISGNAKAAQPSSTPSVPISSNSRALDFARVGLLFVLQETGDLNAAAQGQETIQGLLTSNRNGNSGTTTVTVGTFKMDLAQLTLTLNNGTTIRASPSTS